jgi:hypothetical protein
LIILPPFASFPIYYTFSSFYYLLLLLRHYYYYFKKRMKKFCRKEVHGGAGKQWDAVWIHSKNEKVGFRPDNSRSSGINEGQCVERHADLSRCFTMPPVAADDLSAVAASSADAQLARVLCGVAALQKICESMHECVVEARNALRTSGAPQLLSDLDLWDGPCPRRSTQTYATRVLAHGQRGLERRTAS